MTNKQEPKDDPQPEEEQPATKQAGTPTKKQAAPKPAEKPAPKKDEPAPKKAEPEKEAAPKKAEEPSLDERLIRAAEERLREIRDSDEVWVCIANENSNLYNSADEANFFIAQGQSKRLPEKLTPILENALSGENPLLREATDEELLKHLRAEILEHWVRVGKAQPTIPRFKR